MPASETPPVAPAATYPDLDGKVAVVTGGSRGIGAATARSLAASGAKVAVAARDAAALDQVTRRLIDSGATAISVAADCTVEADVRALRDTVAQRFGGVDILAAFAGGNGAPVPTRSESLAHWQQTVDSELTSAFLTISAFLPGMLAARSGTIITMASAAARQAARSSAAYAAAKAGVIAFSRHLAGEYAGDGIRVNCIAPSAIENERMRAWLSEEQRLQAGASFPLGRLGQPGDIAAATLFLASSASSWITGATLDISGGKVML